MTPDPERVVLDRESYWELVARAERVNRAQHELRLATTAYRAAVSERDEFLQRIRDAGTVLPDVSRGLRLEDDELSVRGVDATQSR